jgi:hypothetical protein
MKQDLVEGAGSPAVVSARGATSGAAAAARRDLSLLYEIDRLSLDRVTVMGEAEVAVQALAAKPAPGPLLGRPGTPGAGHTLVSVGASGRPQSAGRARAGVRLASAGCSSGSSSAGAVVAVVTPKGVAGRCGGGVPPAGGHAKPLRTSVGGPSTQSAKRSPAVGGGGHPVLAALAGLSPAEVQKLQAALCAGGGRL